MTWIIVVRPKDGVEYQILDRKPPDKPQPDWGKALQKAATAIISNFVWWYITS